MCSSSGCRRNLAHRYIISWSAVGLALVAGMAACTRNSTGAGSGETKPRSFVPRRAEFSSSDQDVLNVVLEDLLTYEEFQTYPSWGERPKLVVWEQTGGPSWYISRAQVISELRTGPDLAEVLLEDLAARNAVIVPLESFKASSPRVLVGPRVQVRGERGPPDLREGNREDPFEKRYPDVKAYIAFWLPAYTGDGSTAIVRFGFGPTAHGACGTYLLKRAESGWKIVWRRLAYYA